jgi:hypothetical protein
MGREAGYCLVEVRAVCRLIPMAMGLKRSPKRVGVVAEGLLRNPGRSEVVSGLQMSPKGRVREMKNGTMYLDCGNCYWHARSLSGHHWLGDCSFYE